MDVTETLMQFGLTKKEAEVYRALASRGASTILSLSRVTHIPRPTLYRILESLCGQGVVVEVADDATTLYEAGAVQQFTELARQKAHQAEELMGAAASLTSILSMERTKEQTQTGVLVFRGVAGIRQMEWRMVEKAKKAKEILLFDSNQWDSTLGEVFAESIREQIVQDGSVVYELTSNMQAEPIPPSGKVSWTKNTRYTLHHLRHRILPKGIMAYEDVYVIGDTIQFHGYKKDDVVGVEITNPAFAEMMRSMYWYLWGQSKSFDGFGSRKQNK